MSYGAAPRLVVPVAALAVAATTSTVLLAPLGPAGLAASCLASLVFAALAARVLRSQLAVAGPPAPPAHDPPTMRHDETAELNARLALAVVQAAEAVMMTSVEGRILYVNPAFERITGFSAAEAVGRTPAILAAERQDRAVYRDLWQTILRGEVWRAEITNRRKDGTPFTWEEAITPIRDTRGHLTHFIAVGEDVSVKRQLQAQLLQAQKMEAIGRLAGGVAHDFNNLLTVMTGYSEQLIDRLETRDPLRRKAEAIRGAAQRAAALTQQLLAFSRRQMQQPRVVDLNEAVSRMNRLLRRLIGEDIELVSELVDRAPCVRVDPLHLEQVLMNLAVNARDAMPRGGVLTLETSTVTLAAEDDRSEHPQMPPGDYARLTVADTGCGMDEEVRRRLFEPFFTTKEQGKGTGLGLSTVYGIVKQNGGYIWVDSEPGRGSVFDIYLPLVTEAVDAASVTLPDPKIPRGSETLLVVEDDNEVRQLIKDELQQFGYTVLDASNGGEALLFCERYPGAIDALITDIVMPHMDGYEVAERLRAVRPGMRILYISGYSDQAAGRLGRGGPDDAFLAKPFTPDALALRVRDILAMSAAA